MTELELLKELANIIFIYRKKKKLTLEELSIKTGSNTKFLSSLEMGKNTPQIIGYLKVAKILGIPVSEIEKIINNYFKQ